MVSERPEFLRSGVPFEPLGEGKRAITYAVENYVVKTVKKPKTPEEALRLSRTLLDQYRTLNLYLFPYVLDTQFAIGLTEGLRPTVFIIQPRVSGLPFKEFIGSGQKLDYIRDFLGKSLQMHQETGYIPDFFGKFELKVPRHPYDPIYTKNVIVKMDDQGYKPLLIDTNFSMRSERFMGRMFYNKWLAQGIRGLLRKIE